MNVEPSIARGGQLAGFIRARRSLLLDELIARKIQAIPQLGLANVGGMRADYEQFLDDILVALDKNDGQYLWEDVLADVRRRFDEGLPIDLYLGALLDFIPMGRRFIRELGPAGDMRLLEEFSRFEQMLHGLAGAAAAAYVELVSAKLRSKSAELNRLNQLLQARQDGLQRDVKDAERALEAANEFNRGVIDSLTTGLLVVNSATLCISMYTRRAEEILGLPAEAILGRDIHELKANFAELDLDLHGIIQTVRVQDRLPLTKVKLRLLNGRRRSVLIRGERMFAAHGNPEATVIAIDDVTERELLMESLGRYVSRDVLTRLLARGEALGLEGERRTCTILFADIRGFTTLSEQIAPEVLHELLNAYFARVVDAIAKHGGFIDKFVGDKIMALFCAEADPAAGAVAAARASRDIQQRMTELGGELARAGRAAIRVGVGLNTGEVLLGNIGSAERMDFTAIGDVVNVADRLQSQALGGEVLMGLETARLLAAALPTEDLGERSVKGKDRPIRVLRLRLS